MKPLPTSPEPSTDLVHVVNPATGEALELATADTDRIAQERRGVTGLKRHLDDYASYLDSALNERLDKMNTRSAKVGSWTIETKAPSVAEYPVDALSKALDTLIEAGHLAPEVKDRVIVPQPPPPPKVDKREITKLLGHVEQEVRQAILAVGVQTPQRRTVTVKEA